MERNQVDDVHVTENKNKARISLSAIEQLPKCSEHLPGRRESTAEISGLVAEGKSAKSRFPAAVA